MINRILLTIFSISFYMPSLAQACSAPTADQIEAVFKDNASWMEVERNSTKRETHKPIHITLNFDNIMESKVTMSGRSIGEVAEICSGRNGTIVIKASGQNITVTPIRIGNKTAIDTHVPFLGKSYHFIPDLG